MTAIVGPPAHYVQPLDVYIARSVDWLTAIVGPPVNYVQPLDVYIARSVDWLTAIVGPPVRLCPAIGCIYSQVS